MMKAYLIGLHPEMWNIVCVGVGVLDRGVLNQPVNSFCVLPIRMVMQRDTRFILVQAIEALRPV